MSGNKKCIEGNRIRSLGSYRGRQSAFIVLAAWFRHAGVVMLRAHGTLRQALVKVCHLLIADNNSA